MTAPDPVQLTRDVTWSAVSLLAEFPRPVRRRLQRDLDWFVESAVSPPQDAYVQAAVHDASCLIDLVEDLRPGRRLASWIRWRLGRVVRQFAGLSGWIFTARRETPGEDDVTTSEGTAGYLTLPSDLKALEDAVAKVGAAVILLDPLMSRLGATLDTHKDAEVRVALEPLVEIADRAAAAVLGLIHFNKSGSSDPLQLVMGSKAFTAVARSVFAFARDPDDDTMILVGQVKNNLGRSDLPTLKMSIVGAHVADTDDGPVFTSRIVWQGETAQGIGDAIADSAGSSDDRTATQEAADWLADWLTIQGGSDDSATIKREGAKEGHSRETLRRARRRVGVAVESSGFPRKTFWSLPVGETSRDSGNTVGATVDPTLGESESTVSTGSTGDSEHSRHSRHSQHRPPEAAPTGPQTTTATDPADDWPGPGEDVYVDGRLLGRRAR